MEKQKSAILFGATGLVGSCVLVQLLDDTRYNQIKIFVRKPTEIINPKLVEVVTNFNHLENYHDEITGDDLFCCLGTTIKTAGSQEAFLKIDLDLVKSLAESASENDVKKFIVVSSLGAALDSLNFYYKTKGEMEKAVSRFKFEKCVILRPSMLLGKRKEFRLAEMIGKMVMQIFSFATPAKYKAIKAEVVARAMIKSANDETVNGILESDVIRKLGK